MIRLGWEVNDIRRSDEERWHLPQNCVCFGNPGWNPGAYCLMLWGQAVSRPRAKSDYVRLCDAFCSKMNKQSVADGGSVPMARFISIQLLQLVWAESGKCKFESRTHALTYGLFQWLLMIYQRWDGAAEQLTCCLTINCFHPHSTFTNNFPICPKIDVGSLYRTICPHLTSAKHTHFVKMVKSNKRSPAALRLIQEQILTGISWK